MSTVLNKIRGEKKVLKSRLVAGGEMMTEEGKRKKDIKYQHTQLKRKERK